MFTIIDVRLLIILARKKNIQALIPAESREKGCAKLEVWQIEAETPGAISLTKTNSEQATSITVSS